MLECISGSDDGGADRSNGIKDGEVASVATLDVFSVAQISLTLDKLLANELLWHHVISLIQEIREAEKH